MCVLKPRYLPNFFSVTTNTHILVYWFSCELLCCPKNSPECKTWINLRLKIDPVNALVHPVIHPVIPVFKCLYDFFFFFCSSFKNVTLHEPPLETFKAEYLKCL